MSLVPAPFPSFPSSHPLEAEVACWAEDFESFAASLQPRFARRPTWNHARSYLLGLLQPVPRKNSWQLAEALGQETPYAFQHLLGRAAWEVEGARDDLQHYVRTHLATDDDTLVLDETGFLKSGHDSAGVQRQYSGTAGRIANCQVGVFLALCTPSAQVLIDRELYLPQSWIDAPLRMSQAGVPDDLLVDTKPQLGEIMLQRALEAGFTPRWVVGDTVYGNSPSLRTLLEEQGQAYVLGVPSTHPVVVNGEKIPVAELPAAEREPTWKRVWAGSGPKGPRLYAWLYQAIDAPVPAGWQAGVLIRRHLADAEDLAFYRVFSREGTPLGSMVDAEGTRWGVERCFEEAKQEVGLDEYEVRSWTGWYRHITLSMLAYAFLAVTRQKTDWERAKKTHPLPTKPHSLGPFRKSRGLRAD